MTEFPRLTHIDIGALIGEAGGSPWQVDRSMQCGDPGTIAELGRTFVRAGACTAETYREFEQAQLRFQASWNHAEGGQPINDSAEVQRVTSRLLVQQDQLPAIGAELVGIAADLAEVQRFSRAAIDVLNRQLEFVDDLIARAIAHNRDTAALEDNAVVSTAAVLQQVESLRDDYAARLGQSLAELRGRHGYDPAVIDGVDGDGELGADQRGREATEHYATAHRATDEALAPGDTEAAARLRDYTTATNPKADPEARKLAGERLDDFRMAQFVGPLPTDPILGGNARSRARSRLDMQRNLENGWYDIPAMQPDQATRSLDDGEQFGRTIATRRAMESLIAQGLSPSGAGEVVRRLTSYGGPALAGAEKSLSVADSKALAKVTGRIGKVGDLVEFGMAINDRSSGGSNEDLGASTGAILGGAGGAWAAGAAAAMVAGPWTAGAVAILGDLAGSDVGERIGAEIGKAFDPTPATSTGGRSW